MVKGEREGPTTELAFCDDGIPPRGREDSGDVTSTSDDPKGKLKEAKRQQQRTKTDKHSNDDSGGGNQEWNHDVLFDLQWVKPSLLKGSEDLFFLFEFHHDGVLLGDKFVGECRVPITDLVLDNSAADVTRFVSYEVQSGEGKPNGIVNSVREQKLDRWFHL